MPTVAHLSHCHLLSEFLSCLVPIIVTSQRNHTEVYISYKTDWPISSGFLLTLITYISPLFLSMLATWLGTLFSEAVTSCFFRGLGRTAEEWASSFPEFSCSPCPASTSCLVVLPILPAWLLANQSLFKT